MEVDEIPRQVCKFQRVGNGRNGKNGKNQKREDQQYPDDEEDGVQLVKRAAGGGGGGMDIIGGGVGPFCGWPSSRIVRVSRASGGKDRHSKVVTSKGLRDRRLRLSVTTAIQFYDLQDRLGYDQPSKAVEWLLKAAAGYIAELPSLTTSFPDPHTPAAAKQQLSDEKRSSNGVFESTPVELMDGSTDPADYNNHHQNVSLSKSASSSETSKGSGGGLSLSRSESRIKARERARERAAEKEKEKEKDQDQNQNQNQNEWPNTSKAAAVVNIPISQNSSSFTDLLTGGGSNGGGGNNKHNNHSKSRGHWTTPMDYLSTELFASASSRSQSGQIQLGNSICIPQFNVNTGGDHTTDQLQLQHFSFVPENFVPVAASAAPACNGNGSEQQNYNLDFSISSGLAAGYNSRGTLQSNISPSLPHLQRFPSIDGSNSPHFFIGTTPAPNASSSPMESSHHHQNYPPGLQLCYGDGGRHSDHKGKAKNS